MNRLGDDEWILLAWCGRGIFGLPDPAWLLESAS
jgi:hypothetical protein